MCNRGLCFFIVFMLMAWQTTFADDLRDPTRPIWYQGDSPHATGEYLLQSILISANYKTAVINGQIVKEGEQVDGATVQKINATTVELSQNNRKITIHLIPQALESMKRPPRQYDETTE